MSAIAVLHCSSLEEAVCATATLHAHDIPAVLADHNMLHVTGAIGLPLAIAF